MRIFPDSREGSESYRCDAAYPRRGGREVRLGITGGGGAGVGAGDVEVVEVVIPGEFFDV